VSDQGLRMVDRRKPSVSSFSFLRWFPLQTLSSIDWNGNRNLNIQYED
jgi:hypothetical protein